MNTTSINLNSLAMRRFYYALWITVLLSIAWLSMISSINELAFEILLIVIPMLYGIIALEILMGNNTVFLQFLCYFIPLMFLSLLYISSSSILYDDPWLHLTFIKIVKQYGFISVIPVEEQYHYLPGFHVLFAIYSEITTIDNKYLVYMASLISVIYVLLAINNEGTRIFSQKRSVFLSQLITTSTFYFYLVHIGNFPFVYSFAQILVILLLIPRGDIRSTIITTIIAFMIIFTHALSSLIMIVFLLFIITYEMLHKLFKKQVARNALFVIYPSVITIFSWSIYWLYYDIFHTALLVEYLSGLRKVGIAFSSTSSYLREVGFMTLWMFALPLFFDLLILINIVEYNFVSRIIRKPHYDFEFAKTILSNEKMAKLLHIASIVFGFLGLSGFLIKEVPFPERLLYSYRVLGAVPITISIAYMSFKFSTIKHSIHKYLVPTLIFVMTLFSMLNPNISFYKPIVMEELAPLRYMKDPELNLFSSLAELSTNNMGIYADNDVATYINYYARYILNKKVAAFIDNRAFIEPQSMLQDNMLLITREVYDSRPIYCRGIFAINYIHLINNLNLIYSRVLDSNIVIAYYS